MRQITSFDELQKEQRPPESYWDNPDMLDDWFDIIFKRDKKDNSSTGLSILIKEDEVE